MKMVLVFSMMLMMSSAVSAGPFRLGALTAAAIVLAGGSDDAVTMPQVGHALDYEDIKEKLHLDELKDKVQLDKLKEKVDTDDLKRKAGRAARSVAGFINANPYTGNPDLPASERELFPHEIAPRFWNELRKEWQQNKPDPVQRQPSACGRVGVFCTEI